jgi:hypothetical protein
MRRRVLVSWIGHTDLRAMAATLPPSKRKAIGEADGEVGTGPVKALLDKETFQEIHLLSNYDPSLPA